MKKLWSYNNQKLADSNGERWYFVTCDYLDNEIDYAELPIEFYFRNKSRTYFGMLRFEHRKDNPYRFEKLTEKIMGNSELRQTCEAPETKKVWLKSWK
jgi:hypothetical protein